MFFYLIFNLKVFTSVYIYVLYPYFINNYVNCVKICLYMNIDLNQLALMLKNFKSEIITLKSRQSILLNKIKISIDKAKLEKIKKNLIK